MFSLNIGDEPIPSDPLHTLQNLVQTLNERHQDDDCLLYTSPSPRDATLSRMPSSA